MPDRELRCFEGQGYWSAQFQAMGSPCEILLEIDDQATARKLGWMAAQEVWRIEEKYSRYRTGNIVHRINHSHGRPVEVDEETAFLLDYAEQCYQLSDGLFDITSGLLRKAWHFDGGSTLPSLQQIDTLLTHIGWQRLQWCRPYLQLTEGMEIDLGGIGKEYAVDRCALLLKQQCPASFVINLGGDLYIAALRRNGQPWKVGLEPTAKQSVTALQIEQGAIATSGDTRRFLIKDGVRYGHILNPRTGWPPPDAPSTVTVVAPTCLEAGIFATLAMLQGREAEAFLKEQDLHYRVQA